MAQHTDIYTRVTHKIIADLEKGVRTWLKPWNADHLANRITRPVRHNGEGYRGLNIILLWASAVENGFTSNQWMTFKQAKALGGHVKAGEKGETVIYADTFVRTETGEDGQDIDKIIPYLKSYTVFNVEQIEGLPERFLPKPEPVNPTLGRNDALEAYFAATKAVIRHGGNQAYYNISSDVIQLPPLECFVDTEHYYATLAHEAIHWTRHESRLHRDFGRKKWGDEGYAQEELVAELGSAFLCAQLGITPEVRGDHAAYIHSWLAVLKHDKRCIFSAAAHAQRAVDHLQSYQPSQEQAA